MLEQQEIIARLRGDQPSRASNPIHYFILRARFNPQRHYEIYSFESTLAEDELTSIFDHDPQFIVDCIRAHGNKIYSDRETHDNKVKR
jgi:uncharacterized protein (DUF2249 family)